MPFAILVSSHKTMSTVAFLMRNTIVKINNKSFFAVYQVFAEHLHFQIPYVASKRVNLLKSGPI